MQDNETRQNYEDALNKFVIGYNKSMTLTPVTLHSLEILDEAMDQVEQGLNSIVSAFEEMRATSNSTSENTDRIDSMMGNILAKNEGMDRSIAERMKELETASANAKSIATSFGELQAKTNNIASFTGSIQDVSDRTGILAINASIEAARAGSVGKGFRIIANEVRTLATQTGDFAKQIDSNIGEFRVTVERIDHQMAEFVEMFSRFRSSFNEVLQSFSENARTIGDAGKSLSEITGSIREEAAALNEGLTSLETVNDSMRDTHAILNVIQTSHEFLDNLLEKGTGSDN